MKYAADGLNAVISPSATVLPFVTHAEGRGAAEALHPFPFPARRIVSKDSAGTDGAALPPLAILPPNSLSGPVT